MVGFRLGLYEEHLLGWIDDYRGGYWLCSRVELVDERICIAFISCVLFSGVLFLSLGGKATGRVERGYGVDS